MSIDPNFMKAVVFGEFKGPLQTANCPIPTVKDNEVLVRIVASGVNPVDALIHEGEGIFATLPRTKLTILGVDLSGIVEKVGKEVTKFRPGDAVYTHKKGGNGTYAEYASVPEEWLAYKPQSLKHFEAAAVPCAAITAYQVLVEALKIGPGETILITAGAGGVGVFAVQIAKHLGARVITTVSGNKCDFLRNELGIKDVIDYKDQDFVQATLSLAPGGVDAAFTTIGGETKMRLCQAVKPGGRISWISTEEPQGPKLERDITGSLFSAHADGETLEKIGGLIDAGKVHVFIQKQYPFSQAAQAFDDIKKGHTQGKLVIVIEKED